MCDFVIDEKGCLTKYTGAGDNVIIPAGVTEIGRDAFLKCSTLRSVTIPESVTVIGETAFLDCENLTSVTMLARVTSIGFWTFRNCISLTDITIPDSVVSIGESAFYNCKSLKNITIPESVTDIGFWAFQRCSSLQSVVLPAFLQNIDEQAFTSSGLTKINIPESVKKIGSRAFDYCNKLSSVTITGKNTQFGNNVFSNCKNLRTVYLPEGIEHLGNGMFFGCCMKSFAIPETVKKLNCDLFGDNCIADFHIPDSVQVVEAGAITHEMDYSDKKIVSAISIPGSIEEIDKNAFGDEFTMRQWYVNLTVRGHNITPSMSKFLNANKKNLSILFIDALSNEIPAQYRRKMTLYWVEKALNNENISQDILKSYVKYLQNHKADWLNEPKPEDESIIRFMIREKLLTAPETEALVNTIQKMPELKASLIEYQNNNFTFEDYDRETEKEFKKMQRNAEILADPGSQKYIDFMWTIGRKNPYAKSFKDAGETVVFPTKIGKTIVTGIADNFEFKGDKNAKKKVREIIIPEGYTYIGERAFEGCSNLRSITIPDSMTNINGSAFWSCDSLKKVNIKSLKSWLGIQFSWSNPCSASYNKGAKLYIGGIPATHITIPSDVTQIGHFAFNGCSNLTSVTISDGVTSIGNGAFSECSNLTSITIPNSVTNIGDFAFSDCSSLTSITIPDSVTNIGSGAFSNCSNLMNITIPNSVTSIESHAFQCCKSLTNIIIPGNVTSIGNGAFYTCTSLDSIVISDGIQDIGEKAFLNCKKLRMIDLPQSIQHVGHYAFADSGIKLLIIRNGKVDLRNTVCLRGCRNYTIYAPKRSLASKYIPERTQPLEALPAQNPQHTQKAVKAQAGTLTGLTFVVTGDMTTWPDRQDLKTFIENAGGRLTGSVSGKTNYLIANDPESGTAKIEKARQLGVQIIDEQAFLKLAGVE